MALAQQSEGLSVENWPNGTGTAIRSAECGELAKCDWHSNQKF